MTRQISGGENGIVVKREELKATSAITVRGLVSWAIPTFDVGEGAQPPWVVYPVADGAEEGRDFDCTVAQ